MKLLFKILPCYLFINLILVSCNRPQKSSILVSGSENQWPMSGGPDGSWKVKTNSSVPVKWSVRKDENIKWKKALPEGGQSGIAVWKDKLFLTINSPTNGSAYADVKEEYVLAKKSYDSLFKITKYNLSKSKNHQFFKLSNVLKASAVKWDAFLESKTEFINANPKRKKSISLQLKKREVLGKVYVSNEKKLEDYIHFQSNELNEAFKLYEKLSLELKGSTQSNTIILLCIDANTGKNLWRKTIKGLIETEYNYGFSDGTTPTPATDGKYVWGINGCGGMACFTMEGDLVWERTWMPIPVTQGRPFNKQFDSILFEDLILNVEPAEESDPLRIQGWNYLHAFDKNTGKRLWVTKEAITNYNTPVLGETANGKPAILIGRGGPHKVPERPVGLSLINLGFENQGASMWNWEPKEPNSISGLGALSTQHWDKEKASWFYDGKMHLTIDTRTGKLLDKKSLHVVDQLKFDTISKLYVLNKNFEIKDFKNKYHYQYHCNILHGDYVYFMGLYQPFIKRHNVITGKTEFLELPEEIDSNGDLIFGKSQNNDGLNSKGQLHAFDARIRGGGFQKCFLGSPTLINNYMYFTNAVGLVYVIDVNLENFDENAIVAINDLGERKKTWTVNALSYANGNIYHRTMKEIICIGN